MPRKKAPAAEAPRLVAYYRYSGGSRQTEQSIEGQRRDCEAYARAHGMTILREYVDRHISGKTDDRPAFQQLVADSAAHTFDAVICWKTDRLARNRYDSAVYKKKLRDNGVEILYAAESNISGAEGIIIEGLMEALAEYYSAELAEKARRGMRESALKGKALGSSARWASPWTPTSTTSSSPQVPRQSGISLSSTPPGCPPPPSWSV